MTDNNRETCTLYKKEIRITTFFWPGDLSLLPKQNEDEFDRPKDQEVKHFIFSLVKDILLDNVHLIELYLNNQGK